jgi:hypothetical protein
MKFYVSWYDAERRGKTEFIWMTYEEMKENKIEYFKKILNYCGFNKSDEEIENAVAESERGESSVLKGDIRFNKGVTGRGESLLSSAQKQKIIDLSKYYPWVDFSRIGIN